MMAADTPIILSNPRLPDNPIVAANPAFCHLSGFSADELVGRNCRFMQCAETDRDTVARLRAAIAAAEPIEVVLLNQRRDGQRFWNRLLVAPIFNPDGEVIYFFANRRDVTEEVEHLARLEGRANALEAEAARRGAARSVEGRRLRESQLAAGAASWEWSPQSGEIRWSEGAEAVIGHGEGGALPDFAAWLARVHPDDRSRALAGAAEIGGASGRFEYRLLGDGEPRWMEAIGRVLTRDAAGRAVKVTGMVIDVTERKAAEARARHSEARFRAMAEATPIIVFVTDEAGCNTYVSPQFARFTGLSEEVLLGEGWTQALAPEDRERVLAAAHRSLGGERDYETEFRMRRQDGALRWCLVRAVPIREGVDPRVVGWCGTVTDIQEQVEARDALARSRVELERLVDQRTMALTEALEALRFEAAERARAEDALRQAQKMEAIGQLTGGIAHDFNNLLTAISGSLELLGMRLAQGRGAEGGRHIEAASRAVQRGTALTQRLLAFARRQALDTQPVAADRLVHDMIELIRRTVGPQIDVVVRLEAEATALCDANQLEAALLNLAINARDAMPAGGTLTLATATRRIDADGGDDVRPGEYVEIAVTDDGAGMSPLVRERAFDPFFTTKPVGQGTGLGLSQTYGFVRQSEGFVVLESEEGVGTTVRLFLPRHDAPPSAEASAPPSAMARAPAGARVLVVEDEATLRDLLREALEDLGCVVSTAADGPAGLEIVMSGAALDLLVTDVGLPGLDGRRLAEAARGVRPDLPVLFITGYAGGALDDLSDGADLPAGMQVIGKPFTLAALADRLSEMIGLGRERLSANDRWDWKNLPIEVILSQWKKTSTLLPLAGRRA